jgi:hypothetical protein
MKRLKSLQGRERMRRSIIGTAVLLGVVLVINQGAAWAVPPGFETFVYSPNMVPVGSSLHASSAGVFNSDLAFWGTTAYQGTYQGFRIVDVSRPRQPKQIIDYHDCFGNQGDVIVWEDVLVRSWNSAAGTAATCDGEPVTPGFEGLHVFDISNPANPDLVASVQTLCGSHTASGVPDLANGRLLVYNSSSSIACPWFDIVEVPLDAPADAALLGVAPAGRSCHDTGVILGEAMLAACAGGNGFTVFSLGGDGGGSLTSPQLLYSVSVQGVSIGHSAAFSWDGEILVFGHEPGGGTQARCQESSAEVDKTLFFFDTADGSLLGTWVLPRPQTAEENCTIHNYNVVPVEGKNILVSGNYQSGIAVVDFTDPAAATEIAFADPAPLQPPQLGGDWSSYWYDGLIYESDITRGLLLWKLRDRAVGRALTLGHLNPQTQEFTL